MEYLCSECSTQLSKFEIELNTQFPIGKLYCQFCQSKKEREIIKDLDDFYEPLKTEKVFSLALDVLPNEPPKNSRLIKSWKKREKWLASKLLINPHTAYYSTESYTEMRTKAANNALRIVKGLSPLNKINTPTTN